MVINVFCNCSDILAMNWLVNFKETLLWACVTETTTVRTTRARVDKGFFIVLQLFPLHTQMRDVARQMFVVAFIVIIMYVPWFANFQNKKLPRFYKPKNVLHFDLSVKKSWMFNFHKKPVPNKIQHLPNIIQYKIPFLFWKYVPALHAFPHKYCYFHM